MIVDSAQGYAGPPRLQVTVPTYARQEELHGCKPTQAAMSCVFTVIGLVKGKIYRKPAVIIPKLWVSCRLFVRRFLGYQSRL